MKKDAAKREAIGWLETARKQVLRGNVEYTIQQIRKLIAEANCSLEDIGTNEPGLNDLFVAGCKIDAINTISRWRRDGVVKTIRSNVDFLRKCIAGAGCVLEDFGLTEERLRAMSM